MSKSFQNFTSSKYQDPIRAQLSDGLWLLGFVAKFAQRIAETQKTFTDSMLGLITDMRNQLDQFKKGRKNMMSGSSLVELCEWFMDELESDAKDLEELRPVLKDNVRRPLLQFNFHKGAQAESALTHWDKVDQYANLEDATLDQVLLNYQGVYDAFKENKDELSNYRNAHNTYVLQYNACLALVESYYQTQLPFFLQLSSSAERWDRLIEATKHIDTKLDISEFVIFAKPDGSLDFAIPTFQPPHRGDKSAVEGVIDINGIICLNEEASAILSIKGEDLSKQATTLTSAISKISMDIPPLVRKSQRSLERHDFDAAYNSQKQLSEFRREARFNSWKLLAVRSQIQALPYIVKTKEMEASVGLTRSLTIRDMWKKAVRRLSRDSDRSKRKESVPQRQNTLKKKGISKLLQKHKEDDTETDAIQGPVDPVYSALKCAAGMKLDYETHVHVCKHCFSTVEKPTGKQTGSDSPSHNHQLNECTHSALEKTGSLTGSNEISIHQGHGPIDCADKPPIQAVRTSSVRLNGRQHGASNLLHPRPMLCTIRSVSADEQQNLRINTERKSSNFANKQGVNSNFRSSWMLPSISIDAPDDRVSGFFATSTVPPSSDSSDLENLSLVKAARFTKTPPHSAETRRKVFSKQRTSFSNRAFISYSEGFQSPDEDYHYSRRNPSRFMTPSALSSREDAFLIDTHVPQNVMDNRHNNSPSYSSSPRLYRKASRVSSSPFGSSLSLASASAMSTKGLVKSPSPSPRLQRQSKLLSVEYQRALSRSFDDSTSAQHRLYYTNPSSDMFHSQSDLLLDQNETHRQSNSAQAVSDTYPALSRNHTPNSTEPYNFCRQLPNSGQVMSSAAHTRAMRPPRLSVIGRATASRSTEVSPLSERVSYSLRQKGRTSSRSLEEPHVYRKFAL